MSKKPIRIKVSMLGPGILARGGIPAGEFLIMFPDDTVDACGLVPQKRRKRAKKTRS
jgi:hypothetical protein